MNRSTGCLTPEALRGYLLGTLDESEMAPLGAHLASCATCLGAAEGICEADPLLDAVRAQATPTPEGEETEVQVLIDRLRGVLAPRPEAARAHAAAMLQERLAQARGSDEIGRLGPYRLLGRLGQGGMGIVFRAEEIELRRPVALKVMLPHLAAVESSRRRFLKEAQAAAAIEHDHVVTIFRVGEDRGLPYLAMPLYQGETLQMRLARQGPLAPREIARIGRQIALGLAAAHDRGLIHRDLKPDNIWLEARTDRVKVLDLGLVRSANEPGTLTAEGIIVGTPAYMAPEQAGDEPVDQRADLFSLGSVLYAMCTGKPPFQGRSNLATVRLVAEREPAPIAAINPAVPRGMIRLIEHLHAKSPADRLATAALAAAQLGEWEDRLASDAQGPARKAWRLWGAAVAVALAGVLALGWSEARGRTHVGRLVSTLFGARTPGPVPEAPADVAPVAIVQDPPREERDAAPVTPSAVPKAEPPGAETPAKRPIERTPDARAVPAVYPAAILPFEERGVNVKQLGAQTSDLLFARLSADSKLVLVDRADLTRTLQELELNASGMVRPNEAARLGQLAGAKLLIAGSVLQVDRTIHFVARVIGTETGRVVGASAECKASDDLAPAIQALADKIAAAVSQQGSRLVAPEVSKDDRIAALKRALPRGARPALRVTILERHVGQPVIDPAVETEFSLYCLETGFKLVEPGESSKGKADVLVTGEAFSEFAGRHGNLVSVKARVEIKAVERKTGRVVAVDRQTERIADLTELIAGKSALQAAAAAIAERMLPKLVGR